MPSEDPTPKPNRKSQKPENPELHRFDLFLGRPGFSSGSRFRQPELYTHHPGRRRRTTRHHVGKISRPAAVRRARIRPAKATATANLGRQIFVFSDHFMSTHTSFSPFLDPLNSFLLSLFVDSSLFERYDKNKVGRLLDRVFRQP